MITLRTTNDFARLGRALDAFGRQQLPYAAALALTATARAAQQEVTRNLPAIFSAKGPPTPFTKQAIGFSPARKANLAAAVFVKRQHAKYLLIEETGGVRVRAPGAPVLVPVDVKRNDYGNIPRNLLRKLLEEPETYFIGRARGFYGLWERTRRPGQSHVLRTGRGLRLLVAFREEAKYRPRFGFEEQVRRSIDANLMPALQAGVEKALATAFRR
ncbi:MAG TPA: hypothetical protein VGM07_06190 [Stellaceae bacterium]|jgi:hypothetical protein